MGIVHEARMSRTRMDATRTLAPLSILAIAAAGFFAVTSPFNAVTYLPVLGRFAYWAGLVLLALGSAWLFDVASSRFQWRRAAWLRFSMRSVVSAVPVWIAIVSVQRALARPVPGHFYPELFACVLVICVVLLSVGALLAAARADTSPQGAATSIAPTASRTLHAHLPASVRHAHILALSAEDHYVRVHTESGEHLVLMRLADAVASMPDGAGAQVHRSWWVARDAVQRVIMENRSARIELTSGAVARASRSGLAALKTLTAR